MNVGQGVVKVMMAEAGRWRWWWWAQAKRVANSEQQNYAATYTNNKHQKHCTWYLKNEQNFRHYTYKIYLHRWMYVQYVRLTPLHEIVLCFYHWIFSMFKLCIFTVYREPCVVLRFSVFNIALYSLMVLHAIYKICLVSKEGIAWRK